MKRRSVNRATAARREAPRAVLLERRRAVGMLSALAFGPI
jgi:hypothetical protein